MTNPTARRVDPVDAFPSARPPRTLLAVLSGNMLLDAVEVAVAVVAMPSVARHFDLTLGAAQWTLTAFALGFGVTLPFAGALVARGGRRRCYLLALVVFAVASGAGALAPSFPLLVATRAVKGVCAALTAPTGLAIIAATHPEGPRRDHAVRTYALFGAAGLVVGLLGAGALGAWGWRVVLLAPAPVALVLAVVGLRAVPADDGPRPTPTSSSRSWRGAGPAISGRPRGARRVPPAVGAALTNGAFWSTLLVLTWTLRSAGSSVWSAAVVLAPAGTVVLVVTAASAWVRQRLPIDRSVRAGAVVTWVADAALLVVVAVSGGRPPPALVAPGMTLLGLGFGLGFAALHTQALTGVAPEDRGAVTARYQTAVQLGGALLVGSTVTVAGIGLSPIALPPAAARSALVAVLGYATVALAVSAIPRPSTDSSPRGPA